MENKDNRELYVIKKNDRNSQGLKEARILSKLRHDHIIHIFGAGGDRRHLVVVMEYAQGGSLADRMVKSYPIAKAAQIIREIASGLDFAHRNGVIHGDLRPSNVLFTQNDKIKLTDFGLPPHYNLMEKNWYSAPEKKVSRQADIYALGVILYKMIFGGNPNYSRNGDLYIGQADEIVPDKFREILEKLLALKVANRYQNLEEFFTDLKAVEKKMENPDLTPMTSQKTDRKILKNRLYKSAAIVGAAAVIFIIIIILAAVLR